MLGWLRKRPKAPSTDELGSRIASTIDFFIDQSEPEDLADIGFFVVIEEDYHVSISKMPERIEAGVSVRFVELELDMNLVRGGGLLRHMAVDMAATKVLQAWAKSDS